MRNRFVIVRRNLKLTIEKTRKARRAFVIDDSGIKCAMHKLLHRCLHERINGRSNDGLSEDAERAFRRGHGDKIGHPSTEIVFPKIEPLCYFCAGIGIGPTIE